MTKSDENALASSDAIEAAAAAWLAKIDREADLGDAVPDLDAVAAGDAAFAAWLNASDANRVALLQLVNAWRRSGRLGALKRAQPVEARIAGPNRRARLVFAAAAMLLAVAAPLAYLRTADPWSDLYETEIGGREIAALSDGSKVELNSDTRLAVQFTAAERVVALERGEAFFDVVRDEARPFRVVAGGRVVTVLGTKFSVHHRPDGVEVAVTEGKVRIDDETAPPAARQAVVDAGRIALVEEGAVLIAQADPETVARELSWRQGYIIFDRMRLADAAAEFNRYNRIRLIVDDPTITDIPVSGSFRSDNVDAFVRLFAEGFGLTVERDGENITLSG